MAEGQGNTKKTKEKRQFELAKQFFQGPTNSNDWMGELSEHEQRLLFEELKSHQSLHVAEGNEPEAAQLMDAIGVVAGEHDLLRYKYRRLVISEYERRGMGGRALALMEELYEEYRYSRSHRARSAEIVMEYGILQDRYGDKEEAERLFRHAIGRYKRAGHQYNLAAAWFNKASVLYDLKRYTASVNACEKGLDLGGSEHLDLKTHLLLQRANCREKTKEIEPACQDYLEAAEGYSKLGRRRQQCNILFRVGWIYGKQNRGLDSRSLLNQALKIAKELDYSAGLARFHLKRAQFLQRMESSERVLQHLQHAVMYAKLSRNDKIEKVARGALYRSQIDRNRPLSFYLRARAPEARSQALSKAERGSYSHRVGDGAATRVWRSAPRSAGKDVTFLIRLLAELGRQAHRPELLRQSAAVTAWQRSVREGRRIL